MCRRALLSCFPSREEETSAFDQAPDRVRRGRDEIRWRDDTLTAELRFGWRKEQLSKNPYRGPEVYAPQVPSSGPAEDVHESIPIHHALPGSRGSQRTSHPHGGISASTRVSLAGGTSVTPGVGHVCRSSCGWGTAQKDGGLRVPLSAGSALWL